MSSIKGFIDEIEEAYQSLISLDSEASDFHLEHRKAFDKWSDLKDRFYGRVKRLVLGT